MKHKYTLPVTCRLEVEVDADSAYAAEAEAITVAAKFEGLRFRLAPSADGPRVTLVMTTSPDGPPAAGGDAC